MRSLILKTLILALFLIPHASAYANDAMPHFLFLGGGAFITAFIWVIVSETGYLASNNISFNIIYSTIIIVFVNVITTFLGMILVTAAFSGIGSLFPHRWSYYIANMSLECDHIHLYQEEILITFTIIQFIFLFIVTFLAEGWLLKKILSIRSRLFRFNSKSNNSILTDSPYKISLNMNILSYSGFIILGSTYWVFGLNFPFNVKPDRDLIYYIVQLIMIIAVIIWYRRTKKSKTLIAKSSQD